MACSKISLLICFFLAFLLIISNGVSAGLLENLVAMINLDAEDRKVTHDEADVRAEKSFAQAPASAPTLQASELSHAKEEHVALAPAPASAPDNQFPSSAASGQYTAMDVKPSIVDKEIKAKPYHDDDDGDDDDHDNEHDLNHDNDYHDFHGPYSNVGSPSLVSGNQYLLYLGFVTVLLFHVLNNVMH